MGDSCIVCLGDLVTLTPQDTSAAALPLPPPNTLPSTSHPIQDDPDAIAHLLPCNHELHHSCLRPWVERANSCPICRSDFNEVQISHSLKGPCVHSYAVQEKKQLPDFDPTLVIEDDLFDDSPDFCLLCEALIDDDDDVIGCDSCDGCYHHACVSNPQSPWLCQFCRNEGVPSPPQSSRETRRFRRRGNRLNRSNNDNTEWTQIWHSVLRRTNIDLDFPFVGNEDEASNADDIRRQRDVQSWQQRFRVAEAQGDAERFRNNAAAIINPRNARAERRSTPQETEEKRAWNTFERARREQQESTAEPATRGKRKSRSSTPAEEAHDENAEDPPRRYKKPRTRRVQPIAETSDQSRPEASIPAPQQSAGRSPTSDAPKRLEINGHCATFLQSLLQEVNSDQKTLNRNDRGRTSLRINTPRPSNHSSPRSLSPTVHSPTSSGYPSPPLRAQSPASSSRSVSPAPLTSSVGPAYMQPTFSVPNSPSDTELRETHHHEHPDSAGLNTADPSSEDKQISCRSISHDVKTKQSPPEATTAGQGRSHITSQDKGKIQDLVKGALKPAYNRQEIDREQFRQINQQVSRKLYEKASGQGDVDEQLKERKKWEDLAGSMVDEAVKATSAPGS